MQGVVTAVIRAKGYGFITDEEGRARFFHAKELLGITFDQVKEGLSVTFDPYTIPSGTGNGLRASRVQAMYDSHPHV